MTIPRLFAAAVLATTMSATAQDRTGTPNAADAAAKAPPAQIVIGVVDLGRAFEQYPRYVKMKGELEALRNKYDERLQAVSRGIDELKATLATLETGSEEHRMKELEHKIRLQERQGMAEMFRDRLELEVRRSEVAIYEDLDAATKAVAAARGVHLVLRINELDPPSADLGKEPPNDLLRRHRAFELRQVLYAAEQIDLTPDVIRRMMVPMEPRKDNAKPDAGGAPAPRSGG